MVCYYFFYEGSLTRGTPVCGVRQARKHSFEPAICEQGLTIHMCNKSLCDNKICLADPTAVCRVNPCGGCRHAFYDSNGNLVDCESGLTSCQSQVQDVLNSEAWMRQGGPWNAQPLVITAAMRNPYEHHTDYYRATTVDQDAESISVSGLTIASRLRRRRDADVDEITGFVLVQEKDATESAQEDATETGLVREEDVVTEAELREENGTEETVTEYEDAQLLQDAATDSPVAEDKSDTTDVRSPKFIDDGLLQQVDNSFDDAEAEETEKEEDDDSLLSEAARPALALRDAIKPGFCPPVRSRTFLRVLAQFAGGSACSDQCMSDADCAGATRCCPGECGSSCVNPVLLPTPLLPKPGQCPSVTQPPASCPSSHDHDESTADDVAECTIDADCAGRAKCCFDGCSSSCTRPQGQ